MSELTVVYNAKQNHLDYQLTPAEAGIIEWIRRETSHGRDWMGTIRFVSGPDIFQKSNHVNAGISSSNGRN